MPDVLVVGKSTAGGMIIGNLNNKLIIGGDPAVVVGDAVAAHGNPPHAAAVMVQGSTKLTVNGRKVCIQGNVASCGHSGVGTSKMSSSS